MLKFLHMASSLEYQQRLSALYGHFFADAPYVAEHELPASMKKCGHCQTTKTSKMFSLDTSRGDGLRGWCKVCEAKARSIRYKKHKAAATRAQTAYSWSSLSESDQMAFERFMQGQRPEQSGESQTTQLLATILKASQDPAFRAALSASVNAESPSLSVSRPSISSQSVWGESGNAILGNNRCSAFTPVRPFVRSTTIETGGNTPITHFLGAAHGSQLQTPEVLDMSLSTLRVPSEGSSQLFSNSQMCINSCSETPPEQLRATFSQPYPPASYMQSSCFAVQPAPVTPSLSKLHHMPHGRAAETQPVSTQSAHGQATHKRPQPEAFDGFGPNKRIRSDVSATKTAESGMSIQTRCDPQTLIASDVCSVSQPSQSADGWSFFSAELSSPKPRQGPCLPNRRSLTSHSDLTSASLVTMTSKMASSKSNKPHSWSQRAATPTAAGSPSVDRIEYEESVEWLSRMSATLMVLRAASFLPRA